MARNMSPAELDPLEASAAPITPDPQVRRRRRWGQPEIDAHVKDTIDASEDRDEAHRVLVAQLIADGVPPDEAVQIAARDMARDHFNRPVAVDPTPTPFETDYDEATGGPAARAAMAGMRPQGSLAPQRTAATAAQIRAAGYQSQAEPGPTSVDGSPVQQGERFTTIEDARDYAVRPPMWNPVSGRGPGAAYAPSEKDKAMMARGFVPVYTPDGRVSYMVGTGFDPAYELQPGQIPGAPGRQGVRLDLQQTDPSKPGFTLEEMNGPIGTVYAYRQNDAARAQQQAYMDERQIARMADASGRSEAELAAMSPDERRRAVRDAKRGDAADRMEAWRAQMMLGGGRPTGAQKAAINMFGMLDDPNVDQWQKAVIAARMAPGMQGVTPLTVEAAHNKQLTELGLRIAQGMSVGQGIGGLSPEAAAAAGDVAKAKARQADPAAAGRDDLAAGSPTAEADKELDRLAEQHDSGDAGVWWLGGTDDMSDQDEQNLAATLTKPPYNMAPADAARAARRAAEKRRWSYRKRGHLPPAAT